MSEINTDVNYKTMAGNARLVIIAEPSHNPFKKGDFHTFSFSFLYDSSF